MWLVAPCKQPRNRYEPLDPQSPFADRRHAARILGACALHVVSVGTTSFHLGLVRPSLRSVLRRGIAYASDLRAFAP